MGDNAARYLKEHLTLAQAAQAYFELITGVGTAEPNAGKGPNPRRSQDGEKNLNRR
jgi:hypothetical protein